MYHCQENMSFPDAAAGHFSDLLPDAVDDYFFFDGAGGGAGCYAPPYSSSIASIPHHLPRSYSAGASLSLLQNKNNNFECAPPLQSLSSSLSPVRRVFSAGDLQGMHGMLRASCPVHDHENYCVQEVGGGAVPTAAKVGRYTAEERKERIERYRSKRHHRNFQKKITYACRKTLADSRPRVRGRFARSGEADVDASCCDHEAYNFVDFDVGFGGDDHVSVGHRGGPTAGDWETTAAEAFMVYPDEACSDHSLSWTHLLDLDELSVNLLI